MLDSAVSPTERLFIEHECARLIAYFAERNDARDSEALRRMFVEDATFRRPTKPDEQYRGRDGIVAGFASRPASVMTRHLVLNTVVTVVNAGEARAVSYILLYTAKVDENTKLPVAADARSLLGAFHDTIVRDTDGAWKFKERNGSLAMTIG